MPYYQQTQDSNTAGGVGAHLHEISQELIAKPPVSSINLDCEEWDAWHSLAALEYDSGDEPPYDEDNYPPPSPRLVVTASDERGYVTFTTTILKYGHGSSSIDT